MIVLYAIAIFTFIWGFFKVIVSFDEEHNLHLNRKLYIGGLLFAIISGGMIASRETNVFFAVLHCVFFAYLMTAALCDYQTKMVHDFLHMISGICCIVLLCFSHPSWAVIGELIFFVVVQLLLFKRLYGNADAYVFIVCAMFQATNGHGLISYTLHMAATFLLLVLVQAFRKNISKKGDLKEAVALVPYIAIMMWIQVL